MREYADPVIDWLDADGRGGMIATRLFRESCTYVNGSYVKDLRIVDPDLARVCLVDNSPISYAKDQGESQQMYGSAGRMDAKPFCAHQPTASPSKVGSMIRTTKLSLISFPCSTACVSRTMCAMYWGSASQRLQRSCPIPTGLLMARRSRAGSTGQA